MKTDCTDCEWKVGNIHSNLQPLLRETMKFYLIVSKYFLTQPKIQQSLTPSGCSDITPMGTLDTYLALHPLEISKASLHAISSTQGPCVYGRLPLPFTFIQSQLPIISVDVDNCGNRHFQ